MKPKGLERITLGTAARIKLATGIDLFESVTDFVREMQKLEKEKKKIEGEAILAGLPSEMAGGLVDKSVAE